LGLEVVVGIGAGLPFRVEGDNSFVELLALGRHLGCESRTILLAELEEDFDVRRFFGVTRGKGLEGFFAAQDLLDLFQELVGGRTVADDPIDLFSILVDEELGRRALDIELLVDRVADLVAAAGAIDDEVVVEEIGVLGVVVELLNQQFTGPSATREEVEEDELVLSFGLG
jgi:hypothetical protein